MARRIQEYLLAVTKSREREDHDWTGLVGATGVLGRRRSWIDVDSTIIRSVLIVPPPPDVCVVAAGFRVGVASGAGFATGVLMLARAANFTIDVPRSFAGSSVQ